MSEYKLLLPKMGESVAEATIIKWVKQIGEKVNMDDVVVEIATDKVDSEVPSPVQGTLKQIILNENEVAKVGDVIAILEIEGAADHPAVTVETPAKATEIPPIAVQEILEKPLANVVSQPEVEKSNLASAENRFYSPLIRNIANQEGLHAHELDQIQGTGIEGRLTKDDVLNYLKNRTSNTAASEMKPTPVPEIKVSKPVVSEVISVSGGDEIIEMDRMRKLIADHMVMSKQVAPHVTSFVEADVTNLVRWREKIKGEFEKRENEKITFTPIFVECVIKALKDFPMVNVSVNGTQIIKKKDINIGIAAALPTGNLIVPVIKKADELNLVGLSKSINDLAKRARINKLQPDETQGGTFTVTNIGTFGNIMGTPIINQPQVAILAIGAIQKKPAVMETEFGDTIAIRHKMYLSLSYDHRVVDGGLGGSFLRKIADYMEAWNINRSI